MGFSKVTKPDFAFPKTVSKEATADLQKANERHDAHLALNALIRYTAAEDLIDDTSLQRSIRLVEETSRRYADTPIYGMFPALLAYLYNDFYENDRWVYNSRELPLTPYPADLSEWSGEQFRQKIKDLALESINDKYKAALESQKISRYTDIISTGDLTTTYFPTLYAFCRYNAFELIDNFDSPMSAELSKRFYQESAPQSAQSVIWLNEIMDEKPLDFSQRCERVKNNSDNEYAGILVNNLFKSLDRNDPEELKQYIDLAQGYLSRYRSTPFAAEIKNNVQKAQSPKIEIRVDTYCSPGHPFEIPVTNLNGRNATLNIYYYGDEPSRGRSDARLAKDLMKQKPLKSLPIKESSAVPFKLADTLTASVDLPGYYYILPVVPDHPAGYESEYSVSCVRCIPVFPIAVCADSVANVITVDPYTGSPMKDVSILAEYYYSRKASAPIDCGATNEYGVADVLSKLAPEETYKFSAKVGSEYYKFDNLRIYRDRRDFPSTVYRSCILTDRALYHPGDSLNALVVISRASTTDGTEYTPAVYEHQNITVTLYDANHEIVECVTAVSDDWGRATVSFQLPADGLTGYFTVEAYISHRSEGLATRSVMVSDYKMPDFEIKITEVACDIPVKGAATVKATATSYSGMPIADANVTLTLSESSWGWWRWRSEGSKLYSAEAVANERGEVSFVIPDSVLTSSRSLYSVKLDAVSPVGSSAFATTAFSLSKRYDISLNVAHAKVNGAAPLRPDVKVYAPDGSTAELPLEWALKKGDDTTAYQPYSGEIDLRDVRPGAYTLIVRTADAELADPESVNLEIYNVESGIVPEGAVLWTAKDSYDVPGDGKAEVLLANNDDDTYIYCYLSYSNTTEGPKLIKYDAGYHTLSASLPDKAKEGKLYLYTVKKGKAYSQTLTLVRKEERGLKVTGESFRDRLVPGTAETWKIKIVDAKGQPAESALALDMYNAALDALQPQTFNIYFAAYHPAFQFSASYVMPYSSRGYLHLSPSYLKVVDVDFPSFDFYEKARYSRRIGSRMVYDMADDAMEECGAVPSAQPMMVRGLSKKEASTDLGNSAMGMEEDAVESTVESEAPNAEVPAETFDYRDSDVPMAVWEPMLTTDRQGDVCYTFTVPNANTTWRLKAVAWTKSTEAGALMRDFVASKPVMVQPNLPRFLRSGDNAYVEASVMNNTDTEQTVTTTVEIFDPLTSKVIKSKETVQTIGPKGYGKVRLNVTATQDINALGYRIRCTNGEFSDGEQSVIRVLPSEQALIETTPFYLNPGDTLYTTTLPSDPGARLSLSFCENPAWTIVSALPGLRTEILDYANSAAAALYAAAISRGIVTDNPKIGEVVKAWVENPGDSALVSMLEKNQDLKIAVLTATPWVRAAQSQNQRMANLAMIFDNQEINSSISSALKILADLQNPDGGWVWGKWCNESSLWVTSNVLSMLGDLRRLGWLPGDKSLTSMIDRAVAYYDREVEDTDLLYCLTRPLFSSAVSANGRKVIDATLKDIRKNWKHYYDPAYKAMAAQALYLHGETDMAHELMRSISEFGVMTKDQGLKFPNVNALYNYAILLDAYAMIEPQSMEVDGLRQQLIVRKQATDWGDAVVTMEVVKAILTSGTVWTVDAKGVKVEAGNADIMPRTPMEKATGSFVADISDYPGATLTVTTSGEGPAYGAVYSQFSRQMDKVEASGCDDLDIEKQLFVRRGMEWEVADTLAVGDRVKVQLTIHTKRNMQYIEIIDMRPAAFEPVDQLPCWLWSEGVGFYKENRDAQTNLHVVYMSPGTYLLTYEMNVALAGTFTSGVASIQSQYAPELSAHSSGSILRVSESAD